MGWTASAETKDLCAAAATTQDVQLTVALQNGRAVFHSGEIVPVSLTFTSSVKDRYSADVRNYDRSGRLGIERYCVEPGTSDPLASFYGFNGVIGGGVGSTRLLSADPLVAGAELNEWHTMKPGHYRLYVISYRVWRAPDPGEQTQYSRVAEIVRSNAVEFDVSEPDADWQSEQLRTAVRNLQGASSPEQKRSAARTIRFLNTAEAARELARLFQTVGVEQPEGGELRFGLYGTPHRQLAIDSMHEQMVNPVQPISNEFLRTLVDLQLSAGPQERPPVSDPPDSPAIRQFWSRRQERVKALWKAELERTLAALPGKVGPARTATLRALLTSGELDESARRSMRPTLIATWSELPVEAQRDLLANQWAAIAGPDVLPILRRMVGAGGETDAWRRDILLRHIHELDAEAGRELILREAMNPRAQPKMALVRLLPVADILRLLPGAVERIREYEAREIDYELVGDYGEKGDLATVEAAYEKYAGRWACVPQSAMLRYLLREDPEHAASRVSAALGARKETGCYKELLESLRDQLPVVQQIAVGALNDADLEVARNAATALGRWGTAETEGALWARLKRFHQQWAGRESELRPGLDYRSEGAQALALEQVLVTQIATGSAWFCPPEKLRRLPDWITSQPQVKQVQEWINLWTAGLAVVHIQGWPEDEKRFTVLQYSALKEEQFRQKLTQFPRGTRLLWQSGAVGPITPPDKLKAEEDFFEGMRALAARHGVSLEKAERP
jgi:hypothetical protein